MNSPCSWDSESVLKLRTFLHVGEKRSPVEEHPFQGWLPYLKLDWQPSVQLLLVRSISLSFAMTEPCVGVRVAVSRAGAVRRPARVFAIRSGLCGGLASGFGATTVTLGSVEPGVVCDIAAPVRLHSNAVDRIATAADATKLDDIVILVPPNPDFRRPGADTASRIQPAVRFGPASRSGAVTGFFHYLLSASELQ